MDVSSLMTVILKPACCLLLQGLSGFAAYRYLDEPDSEGCRNFRVFTEAELQEAQGFFSPDREDADSKWAAHSHSPGAAISEEQSVLDDLYADFFCGS